jgi:putative peptide zinc metalloprotease protein
MGSGTFSEHWHRVAGRRVGLRPAVEIRRQRFRGERWFVVLDPLSNQFFRVNEPAHDFVCHLDGRATVQEVWERCLARNPDGAPGQEDVIQLLAQLHQANLLAGDIPPETGALLERHVKRRRREMRAFLNITALRIASFDPDRFLKSALPFVRWLFSPPGAVLWLAVVGAGAKVALDSAELLAQQSEGVLAPGNLPLLYAGLVIIKALHELGHAFACRHFGGEVHRMGVMVLYFSPVPFVDATSSWAFRSKWNRILVSSAGMIVELFVAALAVFVWAATSAGSLHSLAYNMIFVASVTTLLFNANPLMRYDGYYILADALEIPNLAMRSQQMLRHLSERWLFGLRKSASPATSRREAVVLAAYGVLSWVYRVVVFTSIAIWIGGQWLILGALLALFCVYSFTVSPLWKLARYLVTSPNLVRCRSRAVLVTCGAFAGLVGILAWWPVRSHFTAPGILQAEEYSQVFTGTPGIVREVLARPGTAVAQGAPLLRLENREIELELAAARARVERTVAEERRALGENAADLEPIRSQRAVAERRQRKLEEASRELLVTAPHAGTWVSPHADEIIGQWLPRGHRVGELVQDAAFRFTAVISQEDAANLFSGGMGEATVRIAGEASEKLAVSGVRVIPAQQETLPSPALAWSAGGEIASSSRDPDRAAEPFFDLRAVLAPGGGVRLMHGRSGRIRVALAEEPLLGQWYRSLLQLLQRRYQL